MDDRHAERAERLRQSCRSTWFQWGNLLRPRIAGPSLPSGWTTARMAARCIAAPRSRRSGLRVAAAARRSVFGGLVASGWHTAALTMRLIVLDMGV
jgi:hypothetical protein